MTSRPSRWASKNRRASAIIGAKRLEGASIRNDGDVACAGPLTTIVYVPAAPTASKSRRFMLSHREECVKPDQGLGVICFSSHGSMRPSIATTPTGR
jgi:hypothetical protein